MNKKTRQENLRKLAQKIELKALADQLKQSAEDQNETSDNSYGRTFTDALIDSIKIPGLED